MQSAIRDESHEIETLLEHLQATAKERAPTSPAEAAAAAFVNGRLRRAGMGVSTYELRAVRRPGGAYVIVGALGLLATLLAVPAPLPSLLLALLLLGTLLYDAIGAPIPPVGPRRASQNIVGTRAVAEAAGLAPRPPRWRVVLLAPLDTPVERRGLAILAGNGRGATALRLLAPALLLAATLLLWLLPGRGPWWALLAVAGLLFALIAIAPLRPLPYASADGGLAALATLVAAATRLGTLEHVELWAVAVGAAGSDPRGVASLLRRYPFERLATLVIALEQLTGGQLVYATREGAFASRRADPRLLRLAAAADAADPQIDAEPRALATAGTLAAPLRRLGFGALTVAGGPALGSAHSGEQQADAVDAQLVERATRLVVGIVRRLEDEI